MSLRDLLIHRCITQRTTVSRGTDGAVLSTWADYQLGVRCRLMIEQQRVANPAGGFLLATFHKLLVPADTDVTASDRIKSVSLEDGQVDGPFSITAVLPRRGKVERFLALSVERISG